MILSLFVISLIRGDGTGSLTGVIKCSVIDWILLLILLIIAIILTTIGIHILNKEHQEKVDAGYEF